MTFTPTDVVTTGPAGEPSRQGLVLRVLVGCLVVAIVIGLAWWAERATDDTFALPDRLAGYPALDSEAALAEVDEDRRGDVREDIDYEIFVDQLSDQYDGAEALVRSYGKYRKDGTVEEPFVVAEVVRAEADGLVAVPNPPGFPTNAPADEIDEHGDVTCVVHRRPSGSAEPFRVVCQRVDDDLTVKVWSAGRGTDVNTIVDAVNEVWEDLS